jgi:hypothetical protein
MIVFLAPREEDAGLLEQLTDRGDMWRDRLVGGRSRDRVAAALDAIAERSARG